MKTCTGGYKIVRLRLNMNLHDNSPSSIKSQRGFTVFIAALVSSIVLALGISMFDIALKQLALSSLGRESQFAFYAADTAAECALYWDIRYDLFNSSTATRQPTCDSQPISVQGTRGSYPYTLTFRFAPNGHCADVSVTKSLDPVTSSIKTVIRGDGFNTSCATIATSRTALQRSIEYNY